MKKKAIIVMMTAAVSMLFAACGDKAPEETQYLKDIKTADYVTVGEYKGLEVSLDEPVVEDDYLDGYIQYVLQNDPVSEPVTDRAVEMGDVVNIDYEGKLDGVAFEGGTAQGTDLTIGSGRFIPGFEDGVIGMEIGDTKDVEATFPDPYVNNPDLAGKTAVFTVTLNSISLQHTPELTDEYVAGLGIEECTNVEEYKEYVRDFLLEQKQSEYDAEKANLVIEATAANAEFKGAPEGMVARMNETLTSNMTAYANMQGVEIAEFVAFNYGGTPEEYETTLLATAETMAQRYVLMQAIAEQEGFSVSDEELEAEIAKEAETYGYETVEEYKEGIDVEAYREYLLTQEVINFLSENAVVKAVEETAEEPVEDAEETTEDTTENTAE